MRNRANEVIGVLGLYEDITERKLANEKLMESEVRFRELVESIPGFTLSLPARCRLDDGVFQPRIRGTHRLRDRGFHPQQGAQLREHHPPTMWRWSTGSCGRVSDHRPYELEYRICDAAGTNSGWANAAAATTARAGRPTT